MGIRRSIDFAFVASFSTFFYLSQASSHHVKRRVCTVYSRGNPLLDDVREINYALEDCGNTGRIVLWAEDTFHIRSPIDLSLCKRCEFQINGILKVSSDWNYWSKQEAVFRISNLSNIVITSDSSGIIDASNFGWMATSNATVPDKMPTLFSVSDRSSQIYIRTQSIQNVPGTVFHVSSGSSAVRFEGIDIQQPASISYFIENSQHVYIWRCLARATSACFAIAPDSSNVQIEEVNCLTDVSTGQAPNGIELRLSGSRAINSIRNIFVRTIYAGGWFNAVAIVDGGSQVAPQSTDLENVTFTEFNVGTDGQQAVVVGKHRGALTAKDVTFRNFTGVSKYQSDLKCLDKTDGCDFKVEGWNVTLKE